MTATVARMIRESAAKEGAFESPRNLAKLQHLLGKWRQKLIDEEMIRREGLTVRGGPFAGMTLPAKAAEGCLTPKLLGCYEADLHPAIAAIDPETAVVLDIGCAEGYYAVGLARRMPGVRVEAHDTNPVAQEACRELAALNGVGDRVAVGGEFRGADFARFAGRRAFLLMDIEGGEDALLRPDLYPALGAMPIVVECHDVFRRGLADEIAGRFAATHDVERILPRLAPMTLPAWFDELGHMDQLLATWEWRSGPTPWLVMRPKG